jgi:hypothetical protein
MPRPDASAFSAAAKPGRIFSQEAAEKAESEPAQSILAVDGADGRGWLYSSIRGFDCRFRVCSITSVVSCKIQFGIGLRSSSAFTRVINGKIIPSAASAASCKIRPAESFRVFRVFRG